MIYMFGDCVLDTQLYTVQRAGQSIRLRPKVFQLLHHLLRHRDRIISRQELCNRVWPDRFISDATLESPLRAVRQVVGDNGQAQRLIQALHGHGYRFVAAVEERTVAGLGTATEPGASAASTGVVVVASGGELDVEARRPALEVVPRLPPVGGLGGERKQVTVLCAAIGPLVCRMQTLVTAAQSGVAQKGGTLLPVADETLLAVFGLPVTYEDHAPRAVLAAVIGPEVPGALLQEVLG